MDEKPTIHRLSQASDSPDSTSIHRDRKASITSFGHGKSKAEEKEKKPEKEENEKADVEKDETAAEPADKADKAEEADEKKTDA